MNLERFLDLIEDAADSGGGRVGQDGVGLLVGEQDDVEIGPEALDQFCQHHTISACRAILQLGRQPGRQQVLEQGQVTRGFVGEAVVDHHRLEIGVEDHGERRVFKRADEHRLVHKLVFGTAQLPDLLGVGRPARRRRRRHKQHFEVGPGRFALRGRHRALRGGRIVFGLELTGIAAIAARHQRRRDALHQPRRAHGVPGGGALLDGIHDPGARVGLKILEGQERGERLVGRGLQARVAAAGGTRRPGLCGAGEVAPQVEARGHCRKKMVESGCR